MFHSKLLASRYWRSPNDHECVCVRAAKSVSQEIYSRTIETSFSDCVLARGYSKSQNKCSSYFFKNRQLAGHLNSQIFDPIFNEFVLYSSVQLKGETTQEISIFTPKQLVYTLYSTVTFKFVTVNSRLI